MTSTATSLITSAPLLRPALKAPSFSDADAPSRVIVKHPAYAHPHDKLFDLEPHDTDASGRRGVRYAYVHDICAIITGNRFDGWLSTARTAVAVTHPGQHDDGGRNRDGDDDDDSRPSGYAPSALLPCGVYFFHLPPLATPTAVAIAPSLPPAPDLSPPYAIVPNFSHWTFPDESIPHQTLPHHWKAAAIVKASKGASVRERDLTCRITDCAYSTHVSHIIPQSNDEWFRRNAMDAYYLVARPNENVLNASENSILLRVDVHRAWDDGSISIVPKYTAEHTNTALGEGPSCRWAVHVNRPVPAELRALYHNVELHLLTGVAHQYLFARFAYDIFPLIHGFLCAGPRRMLLTLQGTKSSDRDECIPFTLFQGANRSRSPPKRGSPGQGRSASKRSKASKETQEQGDDTAEEEQGDNAAEEEQEYPSDSGVGGFTSLEVEGQRPRRMKRKREQSRGALEDAAEGVSGHSQSEVGEDESWAQDGEDDRSSECGRWLHEQQAIQQRFQSLEEERDKDMARWLDNEIARSRNDDGDYDDYDDGYDFPPRGRKRFRVG